MGYAGLHIDELRRAFGRRRFDLSVVEDDAPGDHCVIRLEDERYPHASALLVYENYGIEPRLAWLWVGKREVPDGESIGRVLRTLGGEGAFAHLELTGAGREDPERLAQWAVEALRARPVA